MRTELMSTLVLLSVIWIGWQTWTKKAAHVCYSYASGIVVIATAAMIADDVQMLCIALPIYVLIGREWKKSKQKRASEELNPTQTAPEIRP